jgi:membrane-associated phospholipid phosphatase
VVPLPGSVVTCGLACACLLAVASVSSPAAAQTRDLPWNPAVDGAVLGSGAAVLVTTELLKPVLAPSECRWCEVDGLDLRVRGALVWGDTSVADAASGVIAFGLAPVSAVLTLGLASNHDGAFSGNFAADLVMTGEATVLAMDLDQLTKFLTGRQRPFVHARPPSAERPAQPDDNLSFFSGHTTATFALAAAAGTVATMRGYRWAPLTWVAGGVLALATGYLRIAADKHWLTDVVTGMAVGVGAGIAVPWVFHRPVTAMDSGSPVVGISPSPGGAALWLTW